MKLSILYRGPLSSCNYSCAYCPFAKTKNSRQELEEDKAKLFRFVSWVADQTGYSIGILFTPWGEGLIRAYYQEAIQNLSHLPNVRKVAIQTNLSCKLHWLKACDLTKVALWTTYHPGQVSRHKFIEKCRRMDRMKVRYSVGVVGFKEHLEEIKALRSALSPSVYLWVNALKKQSDYYQESELQKLVSIDPYFPYNLTLHSSKDESCKAGESVVSVDGDGNMYRCHFIKSRIGNIYEQDIGQVLFPRKCSNTTCGCYIGYAHLNKLNLEKIFGEGILERIPEKF